MLNTRASLFPKKKQLLLCAILTLGSILRIVNASLVKLTPLENQLQHTYSLTNQSVLQFRLPSIIASFIFGYLITIISSRYNKSRSLFPFVIAFLFSISPTQIVLGSTINPYIWALLATASIILSRSFLSIKRLFSVLFIMIVSFVFIEFAFLQKQEYLPINGSSIHLLIDNKENTISIYDHSFRLLNTSKLTDIFLHQRQVSVGPDMSPLSLLIVHDFSHCNFDAGTNKLNLEMAYVRCKKRLYSYKQLNIDYKIKDKRLLSLSFFDKSIYININPLDWTVPMKDDGLNVDKRYSLFTIRASSLYLFSPPGFDIWGRIKKKTTTEWWSNVKRITFYVGNVYDIAHIDETPPYIHRLNFITNNGLSWSTVYSTINLITNVSYNNNDIIYLLISLLTIVYSVCGIVVGKLKKWEKSLIIALLTFLLVGSFFLLSMTVLIPLSIVFLYVNSMFLATILSNANKTRFELAIAILIVLISSLNALPYGFI